MPECSNCGSVVSRAYERVFKPESVNDVRVCPNCPDLMRDGSEIRQARAPRRAGQES